MFSDIIKNNKNKKCKFADINEDYLKLGMSFSELAYRQTGRTTRMLNFMAEAISKHEDKCKRNINNLMHTLYEWHSLDEGQAGQPRPCVYEGGSF